MLLEDRIARAAESVGNRFVGIEVNPRVVVRVRVGTDRQHWTALVEVDDLHVGRRLVLDVEDPRQNLLESPDRVMHRTLSGAGYLAHVLPIHACLPDEQVDG